VVISQSGETAEIKNKSRLKGSGWIYVCYTVGHTPPPRLHIVGYPHHIRQPRTLLLPIDAKCEALAERLISTGTVPPTEPEDALHIALATLSQVDFIATWNFAHLVGSVAKFRLQLAIQQLGYPPPILATPEELLETLP
jgi:hypothetical protein